MHLCFVREFHGVYWMTTHLYFNENIFCKTITEIREKWNCWKVYQQITSPQAGTSLVFCHTLWSSSWPPYIQSGLLTKQSLKQANVPNKVRRTAVSWSIWNISLELNLGESLTEVKILLLSFKTLNICISIQISSRWIFDSNVYIQH